MHRNFHIDKSISSSVPAARTWQPIRPGALRPARLRRPQVIPAFNKKSRTLHPYFITNTINDGQQDNRHRKVLQR
jgi:hypothetical protein